MKKQMNPDGYRDQTANQTSQLARHERRTANRISQVCGKTSATGRLVKKEPGPHRRPCFSIWLSG